jgi:hypothetical protein
MLKSTKPFSPKVSYATKLSPKTKKAYVELRIYIHTLPIYYSHNPFGIERSDERTYPREYCIYGERKLKVPRG